MSSSPLRPRLPCRPPPPACMRSAHRPSPRSPWGLKHMCRLSALRFRRNRPAPDYRQSARGFLPFSASALYTPAFFPRKKDGTSHRPAPYPPAKPPGCIQACPIKSHKTTAPLFPCPSFLAKSLLPSGRPHPPDKKVFLSNLSCP